jgi:hypothetical protein
VFVAGQTIADTGVLGVFSSEVSLLCTQHGIPPVAVCSR